MLSPPSHIEVAGIRGLKTAFKADVATLNRLADIEIPSVWTRTLKASERAKLAFAAAMAEWIAWRLDGVADVRDLLCLAEGLWAAVVDYRYCREIDHSTPEGSDGVGHVIYRTWENANALFRLCQRGSGNANDCVLLVALGRHVLPTSKQTVLKEWLTVVLERIRAHWAMDPSVRGADVRQGLPVPREAFDPSLVYSPSMDTQLLEKFLAALDPAANPYLRSSEEMRAAGFVGTPYRL